MKWDSAMACNTPYHTIIVPSCVESRELACAMARSEPWPFVASKQDNSESMNWEKKYYTQIMSLRVWSNTEVELQLINNSYTDLSKAIFWPMPDRLLYKLYNMTLEIWGEVPLSPELWPQLKESFDSWHEAADLRKVPCRDHLCVPHKTWLVVHGLCICVSGCDVGGWVSRCVCCVYREVLG